MLMPWERSAWERGRTVGRTEAGGRIANLSAACDKVEAERNSALMVIAGLKAELAAWLGEATRVLADGDPERMTTLREAAMKRLSEMKVDAQFDRLTKTFPAWVRRS